MVYSGGPVGIILALVAAPAIIGAFGWPSVFLIFGASGLAWMCAWVPMVGPEPQIAAVAIAEGSKGSETSRGALRVIA